MGDSFGGVTSRNMFDVLNQPKARDSKEKPPAKHEAKEAKKAAAKAAAPPPAPVAPVPTQARTGNKRGVAGAKGTRPPSAGGRGTKGATTDDRGKRIYDRKSQIDYTKNQGGARKGGLHYGGNRDLVDEATAGTEAFNTTGTTDATVAAGDAKAATAEVKDPAVIAAEAAAAEKKRKEEEEEAKTKSFATYEAERAAYALKGDVKEARKPIVGKEFKTGEVFKSRKGQQESLFAPEPEEKKEEKKKEEKKKGGKKKEEVKVVKVKAVPVSIDAFNGPAAAPKAPAPRPASGGAAGAGGAGGAPRGGAGGRGAGGPRRGPGGGPRGPGGRGRGAPIDFGSSFPPLSPVATAPTAAATTGTKA